MKPANFCRNCGRLAEPVRYHMTHSPNADFLKGYKQDQPTYSLHREHIIQAPKWRWERLCTTCFDSLDQLPPIVLAVDVAQPEEFTVYKFAIESQTTSAVYEVTISVSTGPEDKNPTILCDCPWGRHQSNKDQGRSVDWCRHAKQAVLQLQKQLQWKSTG